MRSAEHPPRFRPRHSGREVHRGAAFRAARAKAPRDRPRAADAARRLSRAHAPVAAPADTEHCG
ncbi:hypothetical protein CP967_01785 [Streptomyces nitrosporeus]|uniref:Uncharacterized protein n=1 Tax=Streptomyces nitrosporeus TaxID=28894 RepID=A0A5J6F730_9ACTN|nr:hypothetical protein CP967_01785 [Streptomyces nitrosporeus]